MAEDTLTYEKVYQLIDGKLTEIKASQLRLENKFDTLEAGRLSRLERDFVGFEATVKTQAKNQAAVFAIVITFSGNIFFVILNYFLK